MRRNIQRGLPEEKKDILKGMRWVLYNGPQNLDSVLSYTWEGNEGGPSGEFKEKAHTVI
jgi:hypothetical protein